MKEKLERLNKEDLVEILFRVYEVHQKDVEHYEGKLKQEFTSESQLLLNIHSERVNRIEQYVESKTKRNEEN